jgi:hypothetical protein
MRLKQAPIFVAWYMRKLGFRGWASFWRTAYFLPGCMDDNRLVRHELHHLYQIERDGRVQFSCKYIWWLFKYGYYNNPYEVEAREASERAV